MNTLTSKMQGLAGVVTKKAFATGSKGYFTNGKVADEGGLYQAQVQAVLIGSKDNPQATVTGTDEQARESLARFVETMRPKVFSSGKTGWHTQGKITIGDQIFQASAQAVLIG